MDSCPSSLRPASVIVDGQPDKSREVRDDRCPSSLKPCIRDPHASGQAEGGERGQVSELLEPPHP